MTLNLLYIWLLTVKRILYSIIVLGVVDIFFIFLRSFYLSDSSSSSSSSSLFSYLYTSRLRANSSFIMHVNCPLFSSRHFLPSFIRIIYGSVCINVFLILLIRFFFLYNENSRPKRTFIIRFIFLLLRYLADQRIPGMQKVHFRLTCVVEKCLCLRCHQPWSQGVPPTISKGKALVTRLGRHVYEFTESSASFLGITLLQERTSGNEAGKRKFPQAKVTAWLTIDDL